MFNPASIPICDNKRFRFGDNWSNFLSHINDNNIYYAEAVLKEGLGVETLEGKRFLDIGSGSGLMSLAARRMGATVYSFDYDTQSVACTEYLRDLYFKEDDRWTITQGSVLDADFMSSVGQFDICYAWGVLHHTGDLWKSIAHAQIPLVADGLLYLAIYNDQGVISTFWRIIKRTYCTNRICAFLLTLIFYPLFFLMGLVTDLFRLKNPCERYRDHVKLRGMSLIIDWKDWLGGYPYEVASPKMVTRYFVKRGFKLQWHVKPPIGFGNNQFVFKHTSS